MWLRPAYLSCIETRVREGERMKAVSWREECSSNSSTTPPPLQQTNTIPLRAVLEPKLCYATGLTRRLTETNIVLSMVLGTGAAAIFGGILLQAHGRRIWNLPHVSALTSWNFITEYGRI